MKDVFIAYFDLLGFKEFILNNEPDHIYRRMSHFMRDVELAVGHGNYQKEKNGVVLADLSQTRLNCINISDTIILWTNDTQRESLDELIRVADRFNWTMILYNFPLRGVVLKGLVGYNEHSDKNIFGGMYNVSSLIGSGVVHAHLKADNQDWAGTVIDSNLYDEFNTISEAEAYFDPYAIKYLVPYKEPPPNQQEEYVFRLVTGSKLTEESFKNRADGITRVFGNDNKPIDHPSAKRKLENTIKFLEAFKE